MTAAGAIGLSEEYLCAGTSEDVAKEPNAFVSDCGLDIADFRSLSVVNAMSRFFFSSSASIMLSGLAAKLFWSTDFL